MRRAQMASFRVRSSRPECAEWDIAIVTLEAAIKFLPPNACPPNPRRHRAISPAGTSEIRKGRFARRESGTK
jgi:hypothetical protein